MIFFPAIDLKDGKVVRLHQGDYHQVTQYSQDPLELARQWKTDGIEWLHMVDLNAAKDGVPVNSALITEIAARSGVKVQVGGGIRSLAMAREYLENGVSRVVVGTRAVQEPDFLKSLAKNFPGRVALGLDTKGGKIAIQGWTQTTGLDAEEFLTGLPLEGVACLIFTDIARDGTMQGPNLDALKAILKVSPLPVIASGGVSRLQDLIALKNLKNERLSGVISGKALYEGKFTVKQALEILQGP